MKRMLLLVVPAVMVALLIGSAAYAGCCGGYGYGPGGPGYAAGPQPKSGYGYTGPSCCLPGAGYGQPYPSGQTPRSGSAPALPPCCDPSYAAKR